MSVKRIQKELADFTKASHSNYTACPVDEKDCFSWRATIQGPEDSPYAGGVFLINILFPPDYPLSPPKC